MADFNNLALTTSGIRALLAAQAGATLTLTKIGMGSGSTNNFTSLSNLVTPEVMLPISEKRIDEDSGFMSIVAKMTNQDITEGFYWRETGLFFEDAEGNDVLFAYACVIDDQYDYVPAYSDKRYVKHVRIANILTDSADIVVQENEGLLYVDTLTFEEYKEFVAGNFVNKAGDTMTGKGLYMAEGYGRLYSDESVTQLDHFTNKKDNNNRRQLIVNKVSKKGESAVVISDWENGEQTIYSLYGTHNPPKCNNNILINSNFANPVNQRGLIGDTWNKHSYYGLDRWKLQASGSGINMSNSVIDTSKHRVDVNAGYITVFTKLGEAHTHLTQYLEYPDMCKGKNVTLSVKCRCTKDSYITMNIYDTDNKYSVATFKGTGNFGVYTLTTNIVNGVKCVSIGTGNCNTDTLAYTALPMNTTLDIEWAKLEIGEVATPYVPRLYAEELSLCKRYYQKINPKLAKIDELQLNYIYFVIGLPIEMRVAPTCDLGSCVVKANNNTTQNNFNVRAKALNTNSFEIDCTTKDLSAHGLTYSNNVKLSGYIYCDAEL